MTLVLLTFAVASSMLPDRDQPEPEPEPQAAIAPPTQFAVARNYARLSPDLGELKIYLDRWPASALAILQAADVDIEAFCERNPDYVDMLTNEYALTLEDYCELYPQYAEQLTQFAGGDAHG